MRIYSVKNYEEMSRKAANIVSAQIILKPDCVLGLATGSTTEGLYKQLTDWYKKGDLDFAQVRSVNLDEYKGLPPQNEQSYHYYMNKHLFSGINIKAENTHLPDGMAKDEEKECLRYDRVVRMMGGVDLQILGLGGNGHIGFNEPCENFAKGTHCIRLTDSTITANARFFENAEMVPRYAFSVGIRTIMMAKKILLVVSGKEKANALYQTLFGPINPRVPSSILQLHPDVIIVADEDALSQIGSKDDKSGDICFYEKGGNR